MTGLRDLLTSHGDFARFVRFLIVGLGNTAVGYLVFAGFVLVGLPSQPALAGAFVLGVAWNYWTHARLVFGQGGLSRLPGYVAAYLAIWAANALALAGLEQLGLSPLAAQALLTPVAAVASFLLVAKALTGRFPLGSHRR